VPGLGHFMVVGVGGDVVVRWCGLMTMIVDDIQFHSSRGGAYRKEESLAGGRV
jgi:hypothetical protein